jgi:phosphoglycerate dehydrogenase-like enzyme
MRIAFLDPLEARLQEFPARYLQGHEVMLTNQAAQLPSDIESAEAVMWSAYPVDSALIARMPKLRFMQRLGLVRARGDASAAVAKGIPVSVLPHGVSDRVALHALMLTLAVVRKLVASHAAVLAGTNPDGLAEEETGVPATALNWARIPNVDTLNDKRVGILGFGEIGAAFARMLQPFDCDISYYKRTPLAPELDRHLGVHYAPIADVLGKSDIVMSFVPYSEDSRKMLGATELAMVRPEAIFINCGRGNTVDEPALIDALANKRIAAAGLDVFAIEPLPLSSPILKLDNMTLTPHSAGGVQGMQNTFGRIAENLRRVAESREVLHAMKPGDPQP